MNGFLSHSQKFGFYPKYKQKLLKSFELGIYMSSLMYFKHFCNTFKNICYIHSSKFISSVPPLSFILIKPGENVPPCYKFCQNIKFGDQVDLKASFKTRQLWVQILTLPLRLNGVQKSKDFHFLSGSSIIAKREIIMLAQTDVTRVN